MAERGFYVFVGARNPVQTGYVWRVWARGTSFYLKPRDVTVGDMKISLHGPDPRHAAPGFKLAIDGAPAAESDTATVVTPGFLPCWFPGQEIQPGVRRVATIRTTWDMFGPGVPSGPPVADFGSGLTGAVLEPPPSGFAADIDLFICDKRPFWPDEAVSRRRNAILGPLVNTAGQYLTGRSVRRSVLSEPTPAHVLAPYPTSRADTTRGIGAGVDPRGFVWLCEQRMSRAALLRGLPPSDAP